ncbi:hypothetical protein ABK040_012568 [Willaertia magna]
MPIDDEDVEEEDELPPIPIEEEEDELPPIPVSDELPPMPLDEEEDGLPPMPIEEELLKEMNELPIIDESNNKEEEEEEKEEEEDEDLTVGSSENNNEESSTPITLEENDEIPQVSQQQEEEIDSKVLLNEMKEEEEEEDNNEEVFNNEEESNVLKQNEVNVSTLDKPQWLKPSFKVIMYNKEGILSKGEKRIWEIDFFNQKFNNIDINNSNNKYIYKAEHLYQIDKHFTDSKRLALRFMEIKNIFHLIFESNYHRERFFECASCMRKNLFVWCPSICGPNQLKCITELKGTFKDFNNSKLTGTCKVNVFSKPHEIIKIFTMTWNMGGKKKPKDPKSLIDIITINKYDLYVISTQESGFPTDITKCKKYFEKMLGDNYILLTMVTMWEIQLIILVKKIHFLKISNIQGVYKKTGLGNIAGNKGGVGVSFNFNETSMLFISCHLEANHSDEYNDREYLKIRNLNARGIIDAMTIGNPSLDISSQFNYIFLLGDTNYRIELPYDEGVELAKLKKFKDLLKYDQLKQQQREGQVFYGFKECPIKFPPTYKYKGGTLEFDQKKKRTPSYTDRILFKTFPNCPIIAEKYTAKYSNCKHPSDHLPVQCCFKIPTLRPFASIFTKNVDGICEIKFERIKSKLVIRDEINSPTITFYANWLDSNQKNEYPTTTKIEKMKHPEWLSQHIPILKPSTPHKDYLKLQHLSLAIRDSDNNLIGTCILPLKNAVLKCPNVHLFRAPIHAPGGLAAGIMEGRYSIIYQQKDVTKELM